MCGIFGVIGRGLEARELLEASRLIRHRGPDDEGFLVISGDNKRRFGGGDTPAHVSAHYGAAGPLAALQACDELSEGFLALGHRRLSIVDVSAAGHQPMVYGDRYWIIYNGEVYNYPELREELEGLGYTFDSGSDTEVILAAYSAWGVDCLPRFNGMWGLAIYDSVERTLFLARDRFGVKPLYIRRTEHSLTFGSEIKVFAAAKDWAPKARIERVLDFLVWNVTDQDSGTFFEGVVQLPAGHFALLDLNPLFAGGTVTDLAELKPVRWYELAPRPLPAGSSPAETIRSMLQDSVKLRLRADVSIGSCLSGGLDSSSIVCLVDRELRERDPAARVHTITARSHDSDFDEGRYAHAVQEATEAVVSEVTPNPNELFADLDAIVWHQDEPFVSSSIYAQWAVFRKAAEKKLKVLLDGQGADEVFGGYRGYFGAALAGHLRRRELGRWLSEVRLLKREAGFSYVRSLGYTLTYLWPGVVRLLGKFDNRAFSDASWLHKQHHAALRDDPSERLGARAASVRAMSMAQISATNLPMLLHWEDRNSMAHSIEARVPFLDYRLVEIGIGLRDDDKVAGGETKAVVRRAMNGIVPQVVLNRRDKMGFVTAEPLWVRRDMAGRFRDELVAAVATLSNIISPRLIEQFDEVIAGTRPFDFRYWRTIVTARWVKVFGVELS